MVKFALGFPTSGSGIWQRGGTSVSLEEYVENERIIVLKRPGARCTDTMQHLKRAAALRKTPMKA